MDMRQLEELKDKLMRELKMVSGKEQMTLADISMIDTLTHAIKNLCKVMEEEEGYSGGDWMANGSYGNYRGRGSYGDGYSNRHYVRGHYSRNNGGSYGDEGGRSYRDMLEREYSNASDPREREIISRMMERM